MSNSDQFSTVQREAAERTPPRLCDFIRDRQEDILVAWEMLARQQPHAGDLSGPLLRDHLPELLRRIADVVQTVHTGGAESLEGVPDLHAIARLDLGFDLGAVVTEFKLLRSSVLKLYAIDDAFGDMAEIERFNASIDEALRRSVARYATVRARTLLALDQFSQTALGSDNVDVFLPRLLQVVVDTVDAVDMGAIFLWQDGALRVRASIGMLEGFPHVVLGIGEGFAGAVAAKREPLEFRIASTPALQPRGLPADTKALYGVPLVDHEDLIGVAYIGSRTAYEFAPDDTILLRSMGSRASTFIVQAHLRQAERQQREHAQGAEAQLRQAAEFRETFLGILSHDLRGHVAVISNTARVLLASHRLEDRPAEMVSRISRTAERMSRMVRDLLDFTRGRLGGGIPVSVGPGDLGVVVGQVVDELRAAYPDHDLRLDAGGDLRGEWDADRVAQAVMNLCTNAIQYATPRTPITVQVSGTEDSVVVNVENRAAPLPDAELEHVFEPYRRLAREGRSAGVGLGLFIVREIATAHGGSVTARNAESERVVFTIRLPRSPTRVRAPRE